MGYRDRIGIERSIATAILCIFTHPGLGQVCFSNIEVPTTDGGQSSVISADLNGDGAVDIVTANKNTDTIAWFRNDTGFDPVFTRFEITDTALGANSVYIEDINGDGNPDIISASIDDDTVAWYENTGGANPLFIEHIVSSSTDGAISVYAKDMDNDGDIDILAASENDNSISWFENDGNPNPSFTKVVVYASAIEASAIYAADIDGDGDQDIISAAVVSFEIAWYENNGAVDPTFTYQSISTTQNRPRSVYATDIDNDGDMDVLCASTSEDKVVWFQNNGAADPVFTEFLVSDQLNGPQSVYAEDIDGDGDIDVVAAAISGDEVAWFENNGSNPPSFTTEIIEGQADGAVSVYADDIDSDGDIDVLSCWANASVLAWHENLRVLNQNTNVFYNSLPVAIISSDLGDVLLADVEQFSAGCNQSINFFGRSVIIRSLGLIDRSGLTTVTMTNGATMESAIGTSSMFAGSVDVVPNATATIMGDPVVISGPLFLGSSSMLNVSSELMIAGLPNLTERVITNSANGARFVTSGDLDGDGDLDVISANEISDSISWFQNLGGVSPLFLENEVTAVGSGIRADGATSVIAADIDNDGDLDVAASSKNDDTIAWYENNGAIAPSFTRRVITVNADGALSVYVADLDNDGDLDLMSASELDDTITWYENDGAANPTFTPHDIYTTANGASSVFAADVDGDGDLDIVSAAIQDFEVAWYENDGNPDPFFAYQSISTTQNRPRSVFAKDMDNDGDMDILCASTNEDKVVWFQNDGADDPSFTEFLVSGDLDGPESVFAIDMDNDGDFDVVSAAISGDTVAWFQNDGAAIPSFSTQILTDRADAARSVSAADLDGDGDADIMSASTSDDTVAWYQNGIVSDLALSSPSSVLSVTGPLRVVNKSVDFATGVTLQSNSEVSIDRTSTISGSGQIVSPLISNGGQIRPSEMSQMQINGAYQHFYNDPVSGLLGGVLQIDLSETLPSASINITSTASLGGGLLVTVPDELEPNSGDVVSVALSSSTLDPLFPRFDIVHAPVLDVINDELLVQGTVVASYSNPGDPGLVSLVAIALEDLIYNSSDFEVSGTPNDAVVADISGGLGGSLDGVPDLVVAVPKIEGIAPTGAIAVFFGALDGEEFSFSSVTLYQSGVIDEPVAIEVGDFDFDGIPEIAYANGGGNGLNNDVFFLRTNSSLVMPVFPAPIPPILLAPGSSARDLDVADVLSVGFNRDDLLIGIKKPVLSEVMASTYNPTSTMWESCQVDVDDIDSIEAFPSGLEGGLGLDDVLVASSPSTNTIRVFSINIIDFENSTSADYVTARTPRDVVAVGLDADGFTDIAVMCEGDESTFGELTILRGLGSTFAPPVNIPLTDSEEIAPIPTSLAAADIDDDDDLDLVVVSVNESKSRAVRQLRNTSNDAGIDGISFAAANDIPDQPVDTPLLVVAADLNGDNQGVPDDIIVLVDPGASLNAQTRGVFQNQIKQSTKVVPCLPDLNGDGVLDFFDVSFFLTNSIDYNEDTTFDFFDVSAFINGFSMGCP